MRKHKNLIKRRHHKRRSRKHQRRQGALGQLKASWARSVGKPELAGRRVTWKEETFLHDYGPWGDDRADEDFNYHAVHVRLLDGTFITETILYGDLIIYW